MNPAQLQQLLQQSVTLQRAGKLADASGVLARIRGAAPRNFDGWLLGGNVSLLQGHPAEAARLYTQALRLNPRSATAATCLGVACLAAGDLPAAEANQRLALRLEPKNAAIWTQLATLLGRDGRFEEAIKCHQQAVTLDPKSAQALHGYGTTLSNLNRAAEALQFEQRAVAANPDYAPARRGHAVALQKCHRIPEAVHAYEILLKQNPGQLEVQSNRLFALNYLESPTPAGLFAAHQAYGALVNSKTPVSFSHARDPERKLRVAFFSADFREHSVAYFMEPLLKFIDREKFEILLYNFCPKPDQLTGRFRTLASVWRDFPSHLPDIVEPVVRADTPDLAVDLGGHTGNSLLPLFARRLAPVQLSYLGYPNTTGLAAMDYRLVDAITDPENEADRFATEKLVRFSSTAWAYAPPADAPEPAPPPCLADGQITFGSFNNFSKVTDACLRIWGRLLAKLPRSQLLLKSTGLNDPGIALQVRERIKRAGLPDDRVKLAGLTPTTKEHLASYAMIDVALDAHPYNGTTTTCEALWMGVPVVSLSGDRHAARVGASLLRAAGHPEWIAADADQYIAIAEKLATDPAGLTALRTTLRKEMHSSPLLDHVEQAAQFSEALRDCWRRWCAARM